MNVREAILKAADHIEANPDLFDYIACDVPKHLCGSPGCALGWVSYFLGRRGPTLFSSVAAVIGFPPGVDADAAFYQRMNEISPGWVYMPEKCAEGLRALADEYHPEQYPGIREELTRIFKEEPAWAAN